MTSEIAKTINLKLFYKFPLNFPFLQNSSLIPLQFMIIAFVVTESFAGLVPQRMKKEFANFSVSGTLMYLPGRFYQSHHLNFLSVEKNL